MTDQRGRVDVGHPRWPTSRSWEARGTTTRTPSTRAAGLSSEPSRCGGWKAITQQVRGRGAVQVRLSLITLVLVFRRHAWAPSAAIAIGFSSAVGFTAVHLLPHWSSFSDSFTGGLIDPRVTALSWTAVLFEIGADIALAWAGVRFVRTHGMEHFARLRR